MTKRVIYLVLLALFAFAASQCASQPAAPAPAATQAPAAKQEPPKATDAPKATEAPKAAATEAPKAAATQAPAAKATEAPAAKAAAPAGGTLNIHWRTDNPVSFNPLFSTSGSEQQVERLIFGALLKMSDKLEPIPDLAEKWDIAPDAKTYTFTLRKNIKFSDGQPLTADDVIFTFERAIDKRVGSIWAGRLAGIEGAAEYADQKADKISGLEAPDPSTVRVKLAKPDAAFLTTIGNFSGLGILPKHVLKDVAPDQLKNHRFSTQAPNVSAGAYVLANYQPGQYVELRRNEAYFGAKPSVERIFLKIMSADTALAQLQTGETDFVKVPVSELDRVKRIPNVTVHSVNSPSISQIAVFNERPYFKDKRVRQAIMFAIDRKGIVDSILGGQAALVNSPIIGPEWMGQPEFEKYDFNPAKAKELLKAANWDPNQKVEMIVATGDKVQDAYGAVIQQQLNDVGMKVEIRQIDSAEVNRRYVQTPDYDLFLFGGGVYRAEPSISATYYLSSNATPRGGNGTHYSNPQLDQLFSDGVATADRAKRKDIYTQIAKIVNDDAPTTFLWSPNSIYAVTNRFKGFKPPAYIDNFVWNAEEWGVQ